MVRRLGVVLAACVAVGCGVRAPAPVDVGALLARRGPIEARRDLEIRIAEDGRDVGARLALAALDEQLGRPSEAIDQLEVVVNLGGPIGIRWHDADRARLGRLLVLRGRARLARGAASALADLSRARELGVAVTPVDVAAAREAHALADLRHVDAEVRARGRAELAQLVDHADDPRRGARAGATPDERGRFGAWLWERGARRAAWDELSAWHAAKPAPGDVALVQAYLVAARWWTPLDLGGLPPAELAGAAKCAFGACAPHDVVGENVLERAYLVAPIAPPTSEPADVAAIVVIALHQALRGEAAWGEAIAARVDLAAFADAKQLAKLPRFVQPIVARLAGREAPIPADATTPDQRLVIAAERALGGASLAEIEPLLDHVPYSDELRAVVATQRAPAGDTASDAAVRNAMLAVSGLTTDARLGDRLAAITRAHARDPAVADRLARDAVAESADAAGMHATLGALFDGLGDPARARAQWQAAVDASAEAAFLAGLAETCAREGDADAALIHATTAAAASGDPAVVWTSVARVLADAGKLVHALDAARSAIDLAGPETLGAALDVAIEASRGLGRDEQAERLARDRARLAGAPAAQPGDDPTSARAAIDAYRAHPTGGSVARLWVASRWNPRDVATRATLLAATTAEDPRRGVVIAELAALAGDRDPGVRRAAVAALR